MPTINNSNGESASIIVAAEGKNGVNGETLSILKTPLKGYEATEGDWYKRRITERELRGVSTVHCGGRGNRRL